MSDATPFSVAGVRWWAGPDIDAGRLRALVEAANAALAAGALDRKSGRRKESFLLALEGAAPDYLLKVNHYRSLPPWRRLRSKARAELDRATVLAARGIATPIPVAAGERRRAGLLECCYGLVPWLPDATDLLQLWTDARDGAKSRFRWTRALGALVRRMHDAGVHQEDLAPNNFLWRASEPPQLLAIDFERTRVGRDVAQRDRVFALTKLDRHFAGAPAPARMRFLQAYTGGDREAARRWWGEVAAGVPSLARRDLAHWTRTGARAGRRFQPLALDVGGVAWRGFARREASADALRALVAGGAAPDATVFDGPLALRRIEVAGAREAETAWGFAQLLHQRRLMPLPLALLRSASATVLAFDASGDLVALTDAPVAERHAALVVAIDRLLGLGFDVARLHAGAFAFARRHRRAVLLDPTLCAWGAPPAGSQRAAARNVATRLLG